MTEFLYYINTYYRKCDSLDTGFRWFEVCTSKRFYFHLTKIAFLQKHKESAVML